MLQRLWTKLVSLFQKKETNRFERGVFRYDEKLKRMVKVSDRPAEDGKYAMPLAEYLNRRNHLSKGSWQRPIDKTHASKEALAGDDYGRSGCKSGRGAFHPMRDGKCMYCGLTAGQIKKVQQEADKEKEHGN